MENLEERKQRAQTALGRAYRVAAAATAELAKAAGVDSTEVPMGVVAGRSGGALVKAIEAGVARVLGTGAAQESAAAAAGAESDELLLKAVRDEVFQAEGVMLTTTKARDLVEALRERPVDVYDLAACLPLAKAATSAPMMASPITGFAAERAQNRLEQMEFLAKNATGPAAVSADELRTLRSDAEALAYMRENPLTPIPVPGLARAREDRRPALRRAIEEARTEGIHPSVIKDMERELDFENVRAATARPSGVMTWEGPRPVA